MGVRLKGEYLTDGKAPGSGNIITWQIIDMSFGDLQHDSSLESPGIVRNWNGEARNPNARFLSASVSLNLIVDHNNIDDFITSIKGSDEDRFFFKMGINGTVVFLGILTVEDFAQEDNAYPYSIRLTAQDGMGRMSGKNYADLSGSNEIPHTGTDGYDTFIKHIAKCLKQVGTTGIFAGQPFFYIINDIREDQMGGGDALTLGRVSHKAFYTVGKDTGTYDFKTCQEVLRNILVCFGLRLVYVGPMFVLESIRLRASGGSATIYAYDIDGNAMGTGTSPATIAIDNTNMDLVDRMGVSTFGWIPPLYKAKITYDHGEQDVNMLYGLHYEGDNIPTPGVLPAMYSAGNVDVKAGEIINLRFSGKLRTKSVYDAGAGRWRNHRYHFRIFLNVVAPGYDLWFKREYLPKDFYTTSFSNFGHAQYETGGPWSFDIVTDIIDDFNRDLNLFSAIGFDTQPLIMGEVNEVYFSFQFVAVYDENMNIVSAGPSNPVVCEWEFADLELVAVEDGDIVKRPTKTPSWAIGSVKNSFTIDETVYIGDGPGKTSVGKIEVLTGGEWKDSFAWGGKKLHVAAAERIVGAQKTTLSVLGGGMYGKGVTPWSIITYKGKSYILMSASHTSQTDLWTGEWVEVQNNLGTGKFAIIESKEKVDLPKNPNKLPDDERLEDRELEVITGTAAYVTTGFYTSIALRDAAKYDLYKVGDVINIIDPVHGETDEMEVTQDVKKGDTSIQIVGWTPDFDYPPGSYITLNRLWEITNDYNETAEAYQRHTRFTGTQWDITVATLPDPNLVDEVIMSKRVKLYKNGVKLMYDLNIDLDDQYAKGYLVQSDVSNNKIILLEACDKDILEVYINKIDKEH